jgi:restriction system protein
MAKPGTNKRKTRALSTIEEKGFALCALGLGMLLVPLFMGKSPMMAALATGLRPVGWLTLVVGAVLLIVHHFVKAKGSKTDPPLRLEPTMPLPPGHATAPVSQHDRTQNTGAPDVPAPHMHQPATNWSHAVFAAIEWRRFEAVCEKLFGQAGFETRSQSHGADGGVDIWLHSRNAEGPVAVVQCKHWQGKAVGVKELREFFGVMASHKLARGTYATTSTYTADAQQFAKGNGINALDGKGLLALIVKSTPEQQQALLDVAYEGEYWRPTCASCGIKLVERTPANGSARFWGCSNYPRCKSRLPMVAALR